MQDAGGRMQDARWRMQDAGCGLATRERMTIANDGITLASASFGWSEILATFKIVHSCSGVTS